MMDYSILRDTKEGARKCNFMSLDVGDGIEIIIYMFKNSLLGSIDVSYSEYNHGEIHHCHISRYIVVEYL